MRTSSTSGLAAMLFVAACASAPTEVVFDLSDPPGDTRLEHPPLDPIGGGTFDLERVVLRREGDAWVLEATFVDPVREVEGAWVGRDFQAPILPQTIDVYLDISPGVGHVETLEGRAVRVSAAEAWDRVLVVSSLADADGPDLVFAQSVIARGKKVIARFGADAVPAGVRGALVLVLATSPDGDGRVRPVAPAGDCSSWDDARCTLSGEGPPVMDATAPVEAELPVALTYREGLRPEPRRTPIVFARDRLVGAAPVGAHDAARGAIATLVDEGGAPIASAIVLNVVGDTATLEVIGDADVTRARAVVFAGPAAVP